MATNLTKLELEGLKGIVDSEYRDGSHPVDHEVWTWSANPFKSKKTFSGVVASLVKKGLAGISETGWSGNQENTIWLTQAGYDALKGADPAFCTDRLGSAVAP